MSNSSWSRVNTGLLLIVLLAIVALFASRTYGGPLDPTGAPASTMHSLDDSPVAWDRLLPSNDNANVCLSSRFKCVINGAGLLDRDTGLVWQYVPPTGAEGYIDALHDCMNAQLGGAYGWRLPKIEEFRSLLETDGLLAPGVFPTVQPGFYYWTTTDNSSSGYKIVTKFDVAPPSNYAGANPDNVSAQAHVWCVRGGAGREMF